MMRKIVLTCMLCAIGSYSEADIEELNTTDTFTGPGIPTLDYGAAENYAKQNNTFLIYFKLRYGCAQSAVKALNNGTARSAFVELGMPIVAGAIYGYMGAANAPEFFYRVMLDRYYNADGPYDVVFADPNDSRQTAIAPGMGGSAGVNKYGEGLGISRAQEIASGDTRTKFENKHGLSLSSFTNKRSLYNRDDTSYNCKRRSFAEYYASYDSSMHSMMKENAWKYTSRPRILSCGYINESYKHGLIDATGDECVGHNVLQHIASLGTKTENIKSGPDGDRATVLHQYYYENLQDWYKLTNLETNEYYDISVTDLIDDNADGCVFVFDDEDSAAYATNETECVQRCATSFRMVDSGTFYASKPTMFVCFGLCNSQYLSYKRDGGTPSDITEYNQVVRYKWYLKHGTAPTPTPTPEETTPQYNTNVFVISKLTDLSFEGNKETEYADGYSTTITRQAPATGQLTVHMVWDDVQRGMCQWDDGVTGKQTMDYYFDYDPNFNRDRQITVEYKNFFMRLLHTLVVRDRLVKYMATEHYSDAAHCYDDSGLDLFPVSGTWFVDHDDILRCVDDANATNLTSEVSLEIQSNSSGTLNIGSLNYGTADVYSLGQTKSVVQTNFYPNASDPSIYSRYIIKKTKKCVGTKTGSYQITPNKTFSQAMDGSKVIRLTFPSGSKIYEFELAK